MIKFLVGRTGCGKTYTVTDQVKSCVLQGDCKVFFMVPEQQMYSVEHQLSAQIPPQLRDHLSILSFTRLCDVLEDTYGGRCASHVSKATSALLMWQNLRQLQGLLGTYTLGNCVDMSLTKLMLDTVREFSYHGINAEKLERVAYDLDDESPLHSKLKDIALVSASYTHLMQEMCGIDPTERLIRCAKVAREHGFFENALIFLDSFSSFTMQEYAMMDVMMEQCQDMTVTLSLDTPLGGEPQFESVRDTYRKVAGLARQKSLPTQTIQLSTIYRQVPTELSRLEASIWNFSMTPFDAQSLADDEKGHIRLMTAPTPYEEAQAVALHILDLTQKGVALDKIAVVVRDTENWKGILDAALESYHIPYFLSERTDLNTKPAARLLLLALRCVSRHYQTGDVISLCKTGLCGISPRDLDYFESYVDTWQISGKKMTEPWSMNPDGYTTTLSPRGKDILEAANRVREQVMLPLSALELALKAAQNPTEQCAALYTYLCHLSVKQQLSEQAETLLSLGRVRDAEESVRLWSFLLQTLASIASTLPQDTEALSPEELSQALSLIFAETDIGSVPARHDAVTIGSAHLLRVDNITAMFVLGLCEGEFPRGAHAVGLLSEQDRAVLEVNGIVLDTREERMTSEELLYVYRAMTKPSAYLYLSHSEIQTDGKKLSPSAAFTRVKYLFPYIEKETFHAHCLQDKDTQPYMPPMQDRLTPPRVKSLLGEQLWLSQSKIQRYAHCPYSYFGTHILKLRPQKTAAWEEDQSGIFLHHVMEHFLRASVDDNGKIQPLDSQSIQSVADEIIVAYIAEICGDITANGRLQHTFARLRAIALVLLESIVSELKQSSFLPIGFEWDTHGFTPTDPSPLVLPLQTTPDLDEPLPVGIHKDAPVELMLGGVVDRVDVYRSEDGKRAYVRVIDYKSSKHDFSERTFTQNMDIQLLLYLFTLCADKNRRFFASSEGVIPDVVLPAQAMYISPQEDTKQGEISPLRTGMILDNDEVLQAATQDLDIAFLPTGISRDKNGALKGRALCSTQDVARLEEILHQVILEQAAAMYSGDAKRCPSGDACQFCALRDGCPVAAEKKQFG